MNGRRGKVNRLKKIIHTMKRNYKKSIEKGAEKERERVKSFNIIKKIKWLIYGC